MFILLIEVSLLSKFVEFIEFGSKLLLEIT